MSLSTHRVEVVPITLRKHPNADSLSLVSIYNYQVVVRTKDWEGVSLGAYIPPDSVVPDTAQYAFIHGAEIGTATERQRRIKTRRFRGEWSQGLLMPAPISSSIGDDVAEQMGITHYEPPEKIGTSADAERFTRKSAWPRSIKGWWYFVLYLLGIRKDNCQGLREAGPDTLYPKYDVDTWYRYSHLFNEGEPVVITEKIHGSNARYVWSNKRMWCGSRSEWKRKGSNIWWQVLEANQWIEHFCKENPGVALYGEVVPTQDLKYGGKPRFFAFDIRQDGRWLNWEEVLMYRSLYPDIEWVPVLTGGAQPYVAASLREMSMGQSRVKGADHIREGIVVRPVVERTSPEIGRVQLKVVSPEYLERA